MAAAVILAVGATRHSTSEGTRSWEIGGPLFPPRDRSVWVIRVPRSKSSSFPDLRLHCQVVCQNLTSCSSSHPVHERAPVIRKLVRYIRALEPSDGDIKFGPSHHAHICLHHGVQMSMLSPTAAAAEDSIRGSVYAAASTDYERKVFAHLH